MAMLAGVPFATKIVWNQNTETNHLRQQLRALNLTAKGERVQRSLYQAMRRLASNISARASQISQPKQPNVWRSAPKVPLILVGGVAKSRNMGDKLMRQSALKTKFSLLTNESVMRNALRVAEELDLSALVAVLLTSSIALAFFAQMEDAIHVWICGKTWPTKQELLFMMVCRQTAGTSLKILKVSVRFFLIQTTRLAKTGDNLISNFDAND